jgi:AraC-like DNA-binding protein
MDRIKYEKKLHDLEFRDRRVLKTHLSPTPHLHRELELVCYYGDEPVVAVADSTRCTLQKGDIFLTFPNQIHYYINKEPQSLALAIINPDLMPEFDTVFSRGVPRSAVIKNAMGDPSILPLLQLLAEQYEHPPQHYRELSLKGMLLALYSRLLAHLELTEPCAQDSRAVRAIVDYCARNYTTPSLSLEMLERDLHLSRFYISHLFSEKMNIGFNDYVNSLRISGACRLLQQTDLSITAVSERSGFNTCRTFNRSFSKLLGVSPSEYRRAGNV